MEPSVKAIEGCDTECYVHHHFCAVREVRRLREIVDSLVGAPKEKSYTRYEVMYHNYHEQCRTMADLTTKLALAEERLTVSSEMVPAAWLAKANDRIIALTEELTKARLMV